MMNKMKKILALALALALCLALSACGPKGKSLDQVKQAGKLTVATSPDFPPFEYLEGDKIVGIEVDIMALAAEALGFEVAFEEMDFESVMPGVQAAKYDMGMSGITITEARQKNASFTKPFFLASQAIVVLADSDIASKADLEGKKIAVQTGTTAEEYCMANGYEVLAYQANNDACSALTSGKVDAWVVDNEVALEFSSQLAGQTVVLDEAMTSEPYAFAFAKSGSETLIAALDELIDQWIADGTIQGIFDKYGVLYVAP